MARKKPAFKPEFLITTTPVIRPCRRCGVWLAAGIAEGCHVQAELAAVDDTQAIICIWTKIRLFGLMRTGLVELDATRLTDPRFRVKYPQHQCGVTWERRLIGAGSWTRPADVINPPY